MIWARLMVEHRHYKDMQVRDTEPFLKIPLFAPLPELVESDPQMTTCEATRAVTFIREGTVNGLLVYRCFKLSEADLFLLPGWSPGYLYPEEQRKAWLANMSTGDAEQFVRDAIDLAVDKAMHQEGERNR